MSALQARMRMQGNRLYGGLHIALVLATDFPIIYAMTKPECMIGGYGVLIFV
jgi:hypothetical protein